MTTESYTLLTRVVHDAFSVYEKNTPRVRRERPQGTERSQIPELELALATLLVELASSDQEFRPEERHAIAHGLHRAFGTTPTRAAELINSATVHLGTMRGTGRLVTLLRDRLPVPERKLVLDAFERVLMADGKVDGFEAYLRDKFRDLLAIPEESDSGTGEL